MKKIKFRLKNIHFIGIGGSGMNGIAEVLRNIGYQVSGSDITANANTLRLEKLGIKVFYEHSADNLEKIQVVVVSSAIDKNNIELITAQKNKLQIIPRAQMLAEIMRFRFGIAISGTHGKTTTTSLIAHIMTYGGLDPTYIIGGILNADGLGNRLGKSDYLIAEADESDGSFLRLNPMLGVITNIDKDHMQTYDFKEENLQQAFIDFTNNLPFYGICVACVDDYGVQKILKKIERETITYGLNPEAKIRAIGIQHHQNGVDFEVIVKNHSFENSSFKIKLNLIGTHNVLNCLAAIAICLEVGIEKEEIIKAVASFKGVARRLDFKGDIQIENKKLQVFDDYGHHPSEINAVIESMQKSFIDKNIYVVFQPHRYSRTNDLMDEFAMVLASVENLILLPIYPAGEAPISGVDSLSLASNIRVRGDSRVVVASDLDDCENIIKNICTDEDIILTLGAGNVVEIADNLITKYGN